MRSKAVEATGGHSPNESAGYYKIRPNVAGGIGENTVLDRSVHPPIVSRLHYVVEGWFGDVIVATFPCFLVTQETQRALQGVGFSGATFADAEVTISEECQEDQSGLELPPLVWLKVNGKAGRDDFGIAIPFRLVISKRILDLLESLGIPFAVVEAYDGE
ncbi:hypothetical protein EB815_17525 [Mesorhizobium loti]|uniref:Uncharacterized protein n=1 Tax=Rhizobium loti TaxID=381 RepID=A0A6M7UCB4_RHILI|nr:hypothetical protein A8145_31720 [Mesorhizobium loti]QKC73828.1 hypothetical protein EB815_17525 [Mesorhizobium loti]